MIPRACRTRGPLFIAAALCGLLALLAGSCARREADRGPVKLKKELSPIPFRLSVTGALRAEIRGDRVPVKRLALLDARLPDIRYFGLEPDRWLEAGGAAKVKASVNVLGFAGDGRYVIPVTTSSEGPPTLAQPTALSNARLDYVLGDDPATYRAFALVQRPCVVEIRRSGAAGELQCPALSDGSETVSLVMSWG